VFERSLEQVRVKYGLYVTGYVAMPEHVHLLMSEPRVAVLATALQSLKQSVARRLNLRGAEPFWQDRYYDFNVYSERKRVEKLRYIHRNPVVRGLVAAPEDWAWSSSGSMPRELRAWWRLNRSGLLESGKGWG
jgi:putative transposase